MVDEQQNEEPNLGFANSLIIVLSIYVLAALLIDTIFQLPAEVSKVLSIADNAICLVFLVDFFIRFKNAKNKFKFMKWGWIDLISSIPTLDFMRAGRMFRLIRLFRILRAFRSTKQLVHYVFKRKTQGVLTSAAIISILMVLFSSIAILQVEDDPHSNIKTAEDALWWSYSTITTVGYGDKYPVTSEGKLIAVFVMTV
jgi:voltage-gated potassium channel